MFECHLLRCLSDTTVHTVDSVLLFIILALLQIFSLMAFEKCYLPQNVCLVPTLTSFNIHWVEKSDSTAHGPVSAARLCMSSSVKDVSCVTLLSCLYYVAVPQEVSRYSCSVLAPCVWIIESLLLKCIGHHLTYICIIRKISTHRDHFKHMQAHKLYRLLYFGMSHELSVP